MAVVLTTSLIYPKSLICATLIAFSVLPKELTSTIPPTVTSPFTIPSSIQTVARNRERGAMRFMFVRKRRVGRTIWKDHFAGYDGTEVEVVG